MKRIGLIAMSGVRAHNEELTRLGLTLPGFVDRNRIIASLPSLGLLTLAGLTPRRFEVEYHEIADLRKETELPEHFELVAISTFTAQQKEAWRIADLYRGKNIPVDRIDEYVWGVTLFHDWSIRDGGSSGPQGRPISYNLPKNFDGCASMGPCIVVGELDHRNVDVETRINGEVRQSYNTKEMIWPFGEVLEYLSQDFTFVPGDVIAGGTSAGTAADMSRRQTEAAQAPNLFLKIGDVVELSSPQIGKLGNRIVQA